MVDVKWIKIVTNIFDNRKIKVIEKMPDGDAIIVIWFKLLCLAGITNDNGYVYLTDEVPYTEEMLSIQFDRPLATIQLALKTFEKFGMIEIIDNILHISNWENYQNVEGMEKIREQTRKRVERHRNKQKMISNVTSNVTVTQSNAIDIDKDKDIDKEKDIAVVNENCVKFYNENIGPISPTTAEQLQSYYNDFDEKDADEIICYAIKIAINNNARKPSYIYAILKSWVDKGFKTLADCKSERKKAKVKSEYTEEDLKRIFGEDYDGSGGSDDK